MSWSHPARGDALKDDRREYEAAIADYTEAIRIDPSDARAFASRSEALRGMHELDRALTDADTAIRLDSEDVSGRPGRELADADGTRRNPTRAGFYASRASVFIEKREPEKALADAEEAVRLDPRSVAVSAWSRRHGERSRVRQNSMTPRKRSGSTPAPPSLATSGDSPSRPRARPTRQSPTSTRRSGSTPRMPPPTTTGGEPIETRGRPTRRSPTTTRRSGSTPSMPSSTTTGGSPMRATSIGTPATPTTTRSARPQVCPRLHQPGASL